MNPSAGSRGAWSMVHACGPVTLFYKDARNELKETRMSWRFLSTMKWRRAGSAICKTVSIRTEIGL